MPRFVIGLEHDGHRLRNEIVGYIQESGQPNDQEHLEAIYSEIVSQVIHAFHPDFPTFVLNLMSVPNFLTINYVDGEVDFNLIRKFGEQARAFGVRLWGHYYPRILLENKRDDYVLLLESVTADYLVLNAYQPNSDGDSRGVINDNPAF